MYGIFCICAFRILAFIRSTLESISDAQAGRVQAFLHLSAILHMTVRNRNHHGLHRRQPDGKRAGIVLDQDGDESLEAAEDRAMNDDRPMFGIVGADVFQIEALRLADNRAESSRTAICGRSRR